MSCIIFSCCLACKLVATLVALGVFWCEVVSCQLLTWVSVCGLSSPSGCWLTRCSLWGLSSVFVTMSAQFPVGPAGSVSLGISDVSDMALLSGLGLFLLHALWRSWLAFFAMAW